MKKKGINKNIAMNKFDLIDELSLRTDFQKKDCRFVLDTLIEIIGEKISKREAFNVRGFGQLQYVKIKPRRAYKPNLDGTGEYIDVPEGTKVLFTLAKNLRKGELFIENESNDEDDFSVDEDYG